jgi:DNA replication and repair protein RecF
VHLAHLKLREFRNYARLDAEFGAGFHLLLGDNAQGKTNILEAIYLIATLRSFRGVGGSQMIRHGHKGYFVSGTIVAQGEREVKMYWSREIRKLSLDSQSVQRLTDYLGVLRAVVFCTEDLQLIKGSPRVRRRFMDLLLAQTHPTYLPILQRYSVALRSRNALLKQPAPDLNSVASFSNELTSAGTEIIKFRQEFLPVFAPLAQAAYRGVSGAAEELQLDYHPSVKGDFAVQLAQSRARERTFRMTVVGPHRDELQLSLAGKPAAQFGSEGQKRSVAIALKMAQAEHLAAVHGSAPVLLIDDIMGELDARRRRGFLPLLERSRQSHGQVFMTATEENWPSELAEEVYRWQVTSGSVRRQEV